MNSFFLSRVQTAARNCGDWRQIEVASTGDYDETLKVNAVAGTNQQRDLLKLRKPIQ